jgi:hypothetical protein
VPLPGHLSRLSRDGHAMGRSSDLHPPRLPSQFENESVAFDRRGATDAHSCGYSPGFSPDSLFILRMGRNL